MSIKNELLEFRGVLEEWEKHPPKVIRSVLMQIIEKDLSYQQILETRLYKSIKQLTTIDVSKIPLIYSKNEYESVFEQAKTLCKIIQELSLKSKSKTIPQQQQQQQQQIQSQPQLQQQTPEILQRQNSKDSTNSNSNGVNLFEGFIDSSSSYSPRAPVLIGVSKVILQNYQTANQQQDIFEFDVKKIKKLTIDLEKELYFKNQFKSNPKNQYQQDCKTLVQLLRKDKNGSVTMRLLNGAISTKRAAELKSEDWIDDESKKIQQEIRKQELEAAQTGFYDQIKKREMGQVLGKKCNRCHNDSVYMVDEKQTRCADEPTTKFYECFECRNKFRI